ncbi:MAG: glucosamine-6-phosphate deaminase [Rhodothermales bacterium]|jgi:glucosamine-6-phosphate deaminase
MEIIIQPDADSASELAAALVERRVREHPSTVLGLATGSTPLGLYRSLVRRHQEQGLDFSGVRSFNLDEYVGLPADHSQSYRRFMNENFFDHLNLPLANTHVPDGMSSDIVAECADYEARIVASGGINLQVLGIGSDGHIGFNEPSSSLGSRTRIKTLTEETRADNARFFDSPEDVPKHCITMGIGTILASKQVIMLAFGEHKAETVRQAVEGAISAMVPASALQLHASVKVFLDEAAASRLELRDYYRWVYANKPDWQQNA